MIAHDWRWETIGRFDKEAKDMLKPAQRSYEQRKKLEGYYYPNKRTARHQRPPLEEYQCAVARVGGARLEEADLLGPKQTYFMGLKPRLGQWRMEHALGFVVLVVGRKMQTSVAEAPAALQRLWCVVSARAGFLFSALDAAASLRIRCSRAMRARIPGVSSEIGAERHCTAYVMVCLRRVDARLLRFAMACDSSMMARYVATIRRTF